MPVYQYNITTNIGSAFGTIEADDENHVEDLLIKQFAPKENNFIDGNGKELDIVIESLDLTEVNQ